MMKKYEKYRNSGIDWLGEIPEQWKIESFKNILTERNEKNYPIKSEERLSLSIESGVTLYDEKTTNLDRFKDDFSLYKLTYKNDLVFNSMNMIVGAVGVSNYFGCVSPVYYTYFSNYNSTKFYEYFFRSRIVQGVLYSLGKGLIAIDRGDGKYNTLRLKVSRTDLRLMKIPLPSEKEQEAIAKFLDKKCEQLDTLVGIKESQIEKLKELRQVKIHHAVTKGLGTERSRSANMKDSEIDWIGEIPEHWEVKKVKYLSNIKSGESIINTDLTDSGKYEVYGGNGFIGYYNRFNSIGKKIIIGRVGALCGNVRYIEEPKWISDNALILSIQNEKLYPFLTLVLETGDLNKLNTSNAQPLITGTKVLNFSIPYPPLSEQEAIVSYLDGVTGKIDEAIAQKQTQIQKLKEYKQSLINEVVTGKLRVG